jgi:hypothetical protein
VRLNDPLGHLVPPGQLLPSDLIRGLLASLESSPIPGRPAATSFQVRMPPADRAWLPAGFEAEASRILTEHADTSGMFALDGIRVEFISDEACDMGRPSMSAIRPVRHLRLVDPIESREA